MLKDKINKLFDGYGHHPLVREPRIGDTYRSDTSGKMYRYTREDGTRVWLQEKTKRGDGKILKVPRDGFEDDINLGNLVLVDFEPLLGKGVETSSQATQDARIAKMHGRFAESLDYSEEDPIKLYASTTGKYSNEELVDMCDVKYGWSISKQLGDILDGVDLNEMNMNAIKRIIEFLRSKGENEVADELSAYVAENSSFNPNESKGTMKQMVEGLFQMDWPYYEFRDGYLYNEDGDKAFARRFSNAEEADQWLTDNDVRGSIKGSFDDAPPEIQKDAEEYHQYQMKNDPEYAANAIRRSKMTPQQIDMEDEDLPPGVGR